MEFISIGLGKQEAPTGQPPDTERSSQRFYSLGLRVWQGEKDADRFDCRYA
jgi:hypothetical protein